MKGWPQTEQMNVLSDAVVPRVSARVIVLPPDVGATMVDRIQEAMEFRCFTVEDLAGATDMQPTLLARRLQERDRFMLCEMEAIARACQVPVLFPFDGL